MGADVSIQPPTRSEKPYRKREKQEKQETRQAGAEAGEREADWRREGPFCPRLPSPVVSRVAKSEAAWSLVLFQRVISVLGFVASQ